jgi:hypothetical protein
MPTVPIKRRTQPLGRAYEIEIVGDEEGFELYFTTDLGPFVVNIHHVAAELLEQVKSEIGGWLDEGVTISLARHVTDDGGHSLHADIYDLREKGA